MRTGIPAIALTAATAFADPGPGWRAELETKFHGVRGTVTVVDQDTIRVDDFHYDGRGIIVLFYLGENTSPAALAAGFGVGPQLVRPEPYVGATLIMDLPAGRTIEGNFGVSVWCVDALVDFGSGLFTPPPCGADCDGDGELSFFDFLCYQNAFAGGDPGADCDGDASLTFFDFLCFQNLFAAGCP
jgi:hypothetical protein